MDIVCTIDSREQMRIPYAKKFFNKYEPITVQLTSGDYMFENRDTDESIIFEYKTIKDFISSVDDKRIFKQVKIMNETFDWSFVVIDGTIKDLEHENNRRILQKNTGRPFSLAQFYGAIARLNCYTTVVQCHNQAQAFNYMEKQMLKIFDDKPLCKHFKNDSINPSLNYLAGINGIGYNTSEIVCSEFNINSLSDLLDIVDEDLTKINGIGKKTEEKIKKNILGV